ncbi:MAG: hypothetical protein ABI041_03385, partial [Bdellovibrionia bacterium]
SSVLNALAALAILNQAKTSEPARQVGSEMIFETSKKDSPVGLIARIAGGIIFKSGDQYFLVGDFKEPCCFEEFGFQDPKTLLKDAFEILPLSVIDSGRVDRLPWTIAVAFQGEEGAREVYRRFVIYRNSSVSERLTGLVREVSGTLSINNKSYVDARWLAMTPQPIWEIVRDQILKCL